MPMLVRETIIDGLTALAFDFDALADLPTEDKITDVNRVSVSVIAYNKNGLRASVPVLTHAPLAKLVGTTTTRLLVPVTPNEADQKAAYNSLRAVYQVARCNTSVAPFTTATALRHLRGTAVSVSWGVEPEVIKTPFRLVKQVKVDEKRRIVRLEGSDWHVELSGLTCWYARKGAVVLHNGKLSGGLVLSITA